MSSTDSQTFAIIVAVIFSTHCHVCLPGTSWAQQSAPQSTWQQEQAWQQTRDVELALQLLRQIRDDKNSQLTKSQLLTILQLQLRFDAIEDAEATFNLFPEYVVNASDQQFPYPLTRKMGKRPDQYVVLDDFIDRPTLRISTDDRQVGHDRINSWRVWSLAGKKKFPEAVEIAKSLSVQPAGFVATGRLDHHSREYLSRSAWKRIFSAAVDAGNGDVALKVIEQFRFPRDRRDLLQYNEDKISRLAESTTREKLIEILKEHGGQTLSYKQRKRNFAAFLKSRDFHQLEIMLAEFDETPSRYLPQVIQVMQLYRELQKPEEVNRWLDQIAEAGREFRSSDKELLDLFVQMDRVEDATAYFGPRKAVAYEQYKNVPLEKQPLCGLAIEYARQGRLELAEQIVRVIEEPAWRSGTLAAMSNIVREDLPELSQEWWNDSLRILDKVADNKLHDLRLGRNGKLLLAQDRLNEAFELLASFKEQRRAANALAAWTTEALQKNADLSSTDLRRCIDRVAELDARELEEIVSHFIDKQDVENCIYVVLRLKEDTDIGYFSYILYDFQQVFELARDTITAEQINQIFDNQLPKHRGAIMMRCLRAFEKHERLEEIVAHVLPQIDDCDVDLMLHNTLMRIFIEQGDLERLRELLDREVPDSQFLDDDPVANNWRVSHRYMFAAERLAKKIGGAGMLKFAKSLKLARMRQVANAQALFQLSDDHGIAHVQPICDEIEDPKERADTWLAIIERYLAPPNFDGQ